MARTNIKQNTVVLPEFVYTTQVPEGAPYLEPFTAYAVIDHRRGREKQTDVFMIETEGVGRIYCCLSACPHLDNAAWIPGKPPVPPTPRFARRRRIVL